VLLRRYSEVEPRRNAQLGAHLMKEDVTSACTSRVAASDAHTRIHFGGDRLLYSFTRDLLLIRRKPRPLAIRPIDHVTGKQEHSFFLRRRWLTRVRLSDDVDDLGQIGAQHSEVAVHLELFFHSFDGEVRRVDKSGAVSGGYAPRLFGREKREIRGADVHPHILLAF